MTILDVVLHPNPILRQYTTDVTQFDDNLKKLIQNMFQTMDSQKGVGLAAPQVGILDSLLVVSHEQHRFCLINPKILESFGSEWGEEGCLSIPGIRLNVERFTFVKVQAQDEEGNTIEVEANGFISRIIQHEMDHLKGVLIVDKGQKIEE